MVACGCQRSLPDNDTLATRIERHVQAAHPRLQFGSYARFYAHAPDSKVRAVYIDARIASRRPVATEWTFPDALPIVHDAGCGVVTIEYDAAGDVLTSSRCGVGELDWCREEAEAGRAHPFCPRPGAS